jgi:hypothetical protein
MVRYNEDEINEAKEEHKADKPIQQQEPQVTLITTEQMLLYRFEALANALIAKQDQILKLLREENKDLNKSSV